MGSEMCIRDRSQMETRLRELVQKMAIDEKEERDRAKEKED